MPSKPNPIAEQNLIFAGLGLQLGILSKDKVIRAFTEWLFDKKVPLGQILLQQEAITQEQRNTLESAVKAHVQLQGDQVKALASLYMVKDLGDKLDHLGDAELKQTLNLGVAKRKDLGFDSLYSGSFDSSSTDAVADKLDNLPNNSRDRFERLRYLDSGNLGEVYFAKDLELNRLVVAKYIKPERSNESLTRALFHLEGEVTGSLEHPNIVPVYGLGKDTKGRLYYAMRYIRGRKFTRVIAEYHQIPKSEFSKKHESLIGLLQYFQSACLAIEYAHSKGVLHCDIKPDNIMIGDYGEVFVVDWGLVVVSGEVKGSSDIQQMETLDPGVIPPYKPSELASSGLHEQQGGSRKSVGGTPAYMAPEQFKATLEEDVTHVTEKADIYALGSTLYHLLTGRAPHLPKSESKESPDAFYFRITTGMIPQPKEINPEVSNGLQAIVLKAMEVEPQDRYGSARELAEDVKRWVADEPVSAYQENLREKGSRFARNNKKVLMVVLPLFFIALLGFGKEVVTGGYIEKLQISEKLAIQEKEKAQRSEQEANEQRAKAEKNESLAQQKLKEFAEEENDRERIKKYAREKIDKDMVFIKAGSFMMGASQSEKTFNSKKTPHKVTISKPFMMGKFEVTKEQWFAVMNKNRLTNSADYRYPTEYPISGASWDDCQSFIEKLNKSTKEHYRLPTEAEWEYACRAGTTTKFSFGDRLDEKKAYYVASENYINKNHIPKPVGSYPPNPWGLYDMHGNVWEWCQDWYQEEYPKGPVVDPKGPENGNGRVLRGGCFKDKEEALSSSFRYMFTKITVHNHGTTGFRLVKEIPESNDQKSISQK